MEIAAAVIIFWSLTVALWSLRKRRHTWENRWERGTNITIWLMGLSAVFMAPVIDAPIDLLPDDWETLPGALFGIAAAASINVVVAHRAYPNPKPYLRKIHATAGAGVWTLLILFLTCDLAKGDQLDYLENALPEVGKLYWLIFDTTVGALLASAAWVILTMCKQDHRHEPTGKAYIRSCLAGILAVTVGALAIYTHNSILSAAIGPLFALWTMSFCIASAQSWTRRIQPFDTLVKATTGKHGWATDENRNTTYAIIAAIPVAIYCGAWAELFSDPSARIVLLTTPPIVLTAGILAWALWRRRMAWGAKLETHNMIALCGCVGALAVLSMFLTTRPDRQFFALFPVATMIVLGSIIATGYSFARQIMDSEAAKNHIKRAMIYPAIIGEIFMTVAFVKSNHDLVHFYADGPMNPWSRAYWVVYGSLFIYLIGCYMKLAFTIRKDPAKQKTSNRYLVAALGGIGLGLQGVIAGGILGGVDMFTYFASAGLTAFWLGGSAAASVGAWNDRIKPFEDLLQVTSQGDSLLRRVTSSLRADSRE